MYGGSSAPPVPVTPSTSKSMRAFSAASAASRVRPRRELRCSPLRLRIRFPAELPVHSGLRGSSGGESLLDCAAPSSTAGGRLEQSTLSVLDRRAPKVTVIHVELRRTYSRKP